MDNIKVRTIVLITIGVMIAIAAGTTLVAPVYAERVCEYYNCIPGTNACGYRCYSRPNWVPPQRPLPPCDWYHWKMGWCHRSPRGELE